jgi:hypothetical protein
MCVWQGVLHTRPWDALPGCAGVQVGSTPQVALMMAYTADEAPRLPFDAACVSGSEAIHWLANNTSKPVSSGGTAWPHSLLRQPSICDDSRQSAHA